MHRAVRVLPSLSRALAIQERLELDQPLPQKYFNQLHCPLRLSDCKFDCIFYHTQSVDDGLYQVDPSTRLLSRHELLPLHTDITHKMIPTGDFLNCFLGISGQIGGLCQWKETNHSTIQSNTDEIAELRARIDMLEERLNEVYHAPQMPGYVRAQSSFEGNVKPQVK